MTNRIQTAIDNYSTQFSSLQSSQGEKTRIPTYLANHPGNIRAKMGDYAHEIIHLIGRQQLNDAEQVSLTKLFRNIITNQNLYTEDTGSKLLFALLESPKIDLRGEITHQMILDFRYSGVKHNPSSNNNSMGQLCDRIAVALASAREQEPQVSKAPVFTH